jgi:putative lipase involved disintegration of autophagic bodies
MINTFMNLDLPIVRNLFQNIANINLKQFILLTLLVLILYYSTMDNFLGGRKSSKSVRDNNNRYNNNTQTSDIYKQDSHTFKETSKKKSLKSTFKFVREEADYSHSMSIVLQPTAKQTASVRLQLSSMNGFYSSFLKLVNN